jgi:hypothetical protein
MRKWSFAAILAATALSGSLARADETGTTPAPPAEAPSTPAPPATGTPQQTSPPVSEQAKRHFEAGVALLQDPEGEKVEEAYRQFKAAYDISGSPKVLGNMGLCAMRLERDGEAIDAYSRYLREVPDIDPEERAQIVRDLQTLTVGVTRVKIEVNVPGAMVIDERIPVRGDRVTNAYGPVDKAIEIGIRPGHHVFTVKLAGYEDAIWELEAYAGAKEQHAFALKERRPAVPVFRRREDSSPSITGPVVVLSAGAAMLAGGAITGAIALSKTNDIADRCPNDVCPRSFDLDGERSSARVFVGVTDVLLLLGGAAVVGGLYWLYRATSTPASAPPAAQARTDGLLGDWRLAL